MPWFRNARGGTFGTLRKSLTGEEQFAALLPTDLVDDGKFRFAAAMPAVLIVGDRLADSTGVIAVTQLLPANSTRIVSHRYASA